MCKICDSVICDIIRYPLPFTNTLKNYINTKALERSLEKLIFSFSRAVKDISLAPSFFITYASKYDFDSEEEYQDLVNHLIWKKFHRHFPQRASEIIYITDICMDEGVTRYPEKFLNDKLRQILYCIPKLHFEHTYKTNTVTEDTNKE